MNIESKNMDFSMLAEFQFSRLKKESTQIDK